MKIQKIKNSGIIFLLFVLSSCTLNNATFKEPVAKKNQRNTNNA